MNSACMRGGTLINATRLDLTLDEYKPSTKGQLWNLYEILRRDKFIETESWNEIMMHATTWMNLKAIRQIQVHWHP